VPSPVTPRIGCSIRPPRSVQLAEGRRLFRTKGRLGGVPPYAQAVPKAGNRTARSLQDGAVGTHPCVVKGTPGQCEWASICLKAAAEAPLKCQQLLGRISRRVPVNNPPSTSSLQWLGDSVTPIPKVNRVTIRWPRRARSDRVTMWVWRIASLAVQVSCSGRPGSGCVQWGFVLERSRHPDALS
jgi:hypothetical protein